MSDDDDPVESAPEGAECAVHPERSALVTCPRCQAHCCIACWHASVRRCHACLLRDPPGPPAWANHSRSVPVRFFGGLLEALRPRATAPALTGGHWRQAVSFALLTALPLALLSGVIPFTHTIAFGSGWGVRYIGAPGSGELGFDLAQAAGLGLLMGLAKLGVMAAAFVSLTNAYGRPTDGSPPRQLVLYRAWLVPLSGPQGLLLGLAAWGLPAHPSDNLIALAELAQLIPMILVFVSMTSTARISGVGPFASMVVASVPFVLMFLVEPLMLEMLEPVLPDPEAIRQAVAESA